MVSALYHFLEINRFFLSLFCLEDKKKKGSLCTFLQPPAGIPEEKWEKRGKMRENWDKSGKIEGWEGEKRNPRGLKRALLN